MCTQDPSLVVKLWMIVMKPHRVALLMVSLLLLLLSFSDGWTQREPSYDPASDVTPIELEEASRVVEIKAVLELFRGPESTWPVQHGDRWCWAASAEIIMSSYGRTSWKQCIQADDAFPGKSWPRTCCDDPTSPLCNRTGWPHFEYYGFEYAPPTDEALGWTELMMQIDIGQPVAVAVKYTDPPRPDVELGGHMGVVAGYAKLTENRQAILVIDPDNFHGGMWTFYDEVFGDSNGLSRHWRTYYDISPLP